MANKVWKSSRRGVLKAMVAVPALKTLSPFQQSSSSKHEDGGSADSRSAANAPGQIENEYVLLLPGEREALLNAPRVVSIEAETVNAAMNGKQRKIKIGEAIEGWRLAAILPWLNGTPTAVFERRATYRGVMAYLSEDGEIARIPLYVGDLSRVRPRPVNAPLGLKFERLDRYVPGPDTLGNAILTSSEDPRYENVAALGAEFTGWTLVANEETGPEKSLWLEADGRSREFAANTQSLWAPDTTGRMFEPQTLLPSEYLYDFVPGYSKRTLLGGCLPGADIGAWNPHFKTGYEVMMVLPAGENAHPVGRVRATLPTSSHDDLIPAGDSGASQTLPSGPDVDRYWNGTATDFFSAALGVWNKWHHFFEDRMKVEIPDEWLLNAARAGITLARASYRGYEPTYQVGEGAYTKIPERSHALFPVAHYEFVWAHQLWNLTDEVEPYFQHYLDRYILPDGNFVYNTQDQVEAPLNTGVFLENSVRAYDYTHDIEALRRRLPILRRMVNFVRARCDYSRKNFPPEDPRHGLIWGSPEADVGEPGNDYPESHPYYYQNAAWIWRGFHEHARCLERAGTEHDDRTLREEAAEIANWTAKLRADVERSLAKTLADRNPEMKQAGIAPFTPFDTRRKPAELSSYENHRYMEDWWTCDWGEPELDFGHMRHRELAGQQILGMNSDGAYPRTSNFMSHGTLAVRIRQDDYRPFLLTLYALCCYTMDSGNRYSPEDAMLPGSYPGEGSPYGWSAVVNSELQPALGLRWLLCYEEHDRAVVHLQKAAPKHWFAVDEKIRVENCPTRFGTIGWLTERLPGTKARRGWRVSIQVDASFNADIFLHIHPPDGEALKSSSLGRLEKACVILPSALFAGQTKIEMEIT